MPEVRVAFYGVHAPGKTTTARLVAGLTGLEYWPVEAVGYASDLPPVERQLVFLASYRLIHSGL